MATGDPKRLIFTFMLPLMGGNLLQQLYTVTDAAIVGKGVGVDALVAIGSTDWNYWFMLWAAVGFGQGLSILTANYFGEKNYSMLRKSVNTSLWLSFTAGTGLAMAYRYLFIMGTLLLALYAVNTYRSTVMAMNWMVLAVLGNAYSLNFQSTLRQTYAQFQSETFPLEQDVEKF